MRLVLNTLNKSWNTKTGYAFSDLYLIFAPPNNLK
jgi:hypothetical protein